jgi:hypothetical protein
MRLQDQIRDIMIRRIEDYLENECHFRDYEFYSVADFGLVGKPSSINIKYPTKKCLDDALDVFCRDGYNTINLYL